VWACIVAVLWLISVSGVTADPKDMGGWGIDDPYNRNYDAAELDNFKAKVVKITEVVPLSGMASGIALIVREGDDPETIMVHLCPKWFADKKSIGIRRGDKVKIRGAWAEINGQDVFMASKVKKGDHFEFKVRLTHNGQPFWTMSDEELARERASQ
jgi:hypothetical protein